MCKVMQDLSTIQGQTEAPLDGLMAKGWVSGLRERMLHGTAQSFTYSEYIKPVCQSTWTPEGEANLRTAAMCLDARSRKP